MSTPVLSCKGLTKSYKRKHPVLKNFDFELQSGRIVGLLGPNGCGKSTLMKLVTGLLVPDEGEIYVCGEERSEKTNAYISYLPERTYFNSWMRVSELIKYFSEFYADFDAELARRMLDDLSVDRSAAMKTLSKGTKEKVQLVLVMSRRARLYMLDEPIGGVDPAARDYVLRTIISNYSPESSIIITTHLIADIEQAIDDFAFMHHGGKIHMYGNADTVREQSGKSLDQLFREVFRC